MGAKGMSFAYQTLFFRPQGSWILFFNCLRLTPCKWSRCQTPINQHLREPTSVEDTVMKANPNLPHPVAVIAKLLLIHLWSVLLRKERSQLLCWRKAEVLFCFCRKFYHLVSAFTSEWPSAVSHKNQLPQGSLSFYCLFSQCLYSFANILVID